MKKIYFTTVLIISVFIAQSQIINIPDANFKNQLVNTLCADINNDGQTSERVDTNHDGEIDVAEAAAVYMLDLANSDLNPGPEDITDITGIGYFTNLQSLDIKNNNISLLPALPLGLKIFDCSYNPLTVLNVSMLSALEKLMCQSTLATTIDVSGLQNLSGFFVI